MRKLKTRWIIGLTIVFSPGYSFAQDIISQKSCNSSAYQKQIDSVKSVYQKSGYNLLREASMVMESQYEMPVVIPMNLKSNYSFVFIGDPKSRLFEVRVADYTEGQVYYEKKLAGDRDANVISFVYTPPATNYYVFKPLQIKKGKDILCGYVLLFKQEAISR
jgi:hypothetical protein